MGCIASKQGDSLNNKEERLVEQEHITGLTKKQRWIAMKAKLYSNKTCRFLLKSSWKGVSRDLEYTGVKWLVG